MEDITFVRDCATLRSIVGNIDQVRQEMDEARLAIKARERGHFLPQEDDWAKRMFGAYRGYRIAVYDIINRRENYEDFEVRESASSFLVGFASAVLLYHWSSLVVETFRGIKTIRNKLNEGDTRFGIEPGLFDLIYRNLTRVDTQERLSAAIDYYSAWRSEFEEMFPSGSEQAWLMQLVEGRYEELRRNPMQIWTRRIDRDIDITARRASKPLFEAVYRIQSLLFDVFGNIWLDHLPSIPDEHLDAFDAIAQPGDFFIVRPERKSSTVFLPGWWTHAAVYHGGVQKLRDYGAIDLPNVQKVLPDLEHPINGQSPVILEALSAGVVLNPIKDSMHVDHAVLFRPNLSDNQRLQSLDDIFGHYGKPYDFEFDFSRSDRLVCTELVYRGFDGLGPIRFETSSRFGRPTLSADDIISHAVRWLDESDIPPLQLLAMSHKNISTGKSSYLTGTNAVECLRKTAQLSN